MNRRSFARGAVAATLVALLGGGAAASGAPPEPFHLRPIEPGTGALFEARPVLFDTNLGRNLDLRFGVGALAEVRAAILDRHVHFVLGFPFGIGFAERHSPLGLGNVDLGAGVAGSLGSRVDWGIGARFEPSTAATSDPAPQWAGLASRPYDMQRHLPASTNGHLVVDVAGDFGSYFAQVETGLGLHDPDDFDPELFARLGALVGRSVAPWADLMFEISWLGAPLESEWNGQASVQPGVRFHRQPFDLAVYGSIPLDSPLGGTAAALGLQGIWTPGDARPSPLGLHDSLPQRERTVRRERQERRRNRAGEDEPRG